MGNKPFNKLYSEFYANYDHNDPFRAYVEENYFHHTNMYGGEEFSTTDMKSARKLWKKNKRLWYPSNFEWGLSINAMPFGGWASEQDENNFIKSYEKALKEGHAQGLGENTITRIFMQKYVPDWK